MPPPSTLPLPPEPPSVLPADPGASQVTIDLTGQTALHFSGVGNAPLLKAFGTGPMHVHYLCSACDLARAVEENHAAMARSRYWVTKAGDAYWDDLTFNFGPRRVVFAEVGRVIGFATTAQAAKQLAEDFLSKYQVTVPPAGGSFQLIRVQNQIDSECVTLGAETMLSDHLLDLHYGDGFSKWHGEFVSELPARSSGLSILEGSPGTGKTSYLRHLIGVLRKTHRFYYVQPSHMAMLSKPEFVPFWVGERMRHRDRRLVVILEDAEEAIMRRGTDNSAHVSAILNLSDGLLGDFMRLHVICTMNCTATDIDPALLRPGRLQSHRVFPRLDLQNANRLAQHLGKGLPEAEDYSLAEIFAGQGVEEPVRPRIGFAI